MLWSLWVCVLQISVFWAHTLPKPQAVSHWIRRKNSQLNKRRPPARPTHSTGNHAWTWDHTHVCTWACTETVCTHTPHSYSSLWLLFTQAMFFFHSIVPIHLLINSPFAVVIFISSTCSFFSCYRVSTKIYSISQVCRDKVFFMVSTYCCKS